MALNRKQKIFINASTVMISGGLYVTLDIIKALLEQKEYEFKVIAPEIPAFRKEIDAGVLEFVPKRYFHYFFRPWLDYFWVPRRIKDFAADRVISFSNLPAISACFQLFYNQNAFITVASLKGKHLKLRSFLTHGLRRYIFKKRLKYVDRIIVQTELEKEKMSTITSGNIPVDVLPPLLPSHLSEGSRGTYSFPGTSEIRIACLSRYFDHKNLEVLYEAAKLFTHENIPVQMILTIQKNQGAGARRLIKRINRDNLKDHIFNAGKIPQARISQFICSVDGLILPSVCESFSITSLEAWFHNRSYFISDLDFAHETCGGGAHYFSPEKIEEIRNIIQHILFDKQQDNENAIQGEINLKKLPDQEEVCAKFLA